MAVDPVTLPGGGSPIACDQIAGNFWQYTKVAWGADGSATPVDNAGNQLPVVQQDGLAVTGTATGTGVIWTQSCVPYETVSLGVACSDAFLSGGLIVFEVTVDGTNWKQINVLNLAFDFPGNWNQLFYATQSLVSGCAFASFRARCTAYGGNPITVSALFRKTGTAPVNQPITNVNVKAIVGPADPDPGFAPFVYSSAALETGVNIKSSLTMLWRARCWSSVAGYLLLLNSAGGVPATLSAVVPQEIIPVPANGLGYLDLPGSMSETFSAGLVAIFSINASPLTYTASSTALLNIQYR